MKNIALLFSYNNELAWETYRGISRYSACEDDWVLHRIPLKIMDEKSVAEWAFDGLISATMDQQHLETIARIPFPCICIGNVPHPDIPIIEDDDFAVGQLAAEYYLQNGFRTFAHLPSPFDYHQQRLDGFEQTLQKYRFTSARLSGLIEAIREDQTARALTILQALPRPVAVYSPYDFPAFLLCRFCRQNHLPVPEEIAILGSQNEVAECERITPSISSVHIPYFEKGYKAAELLSAKMRGKTTALRTVLPPTHIAVRQSTSTLAVRDGSVRKALIHLRKHYREKININDLARLTGTARRSLERRFREHLQTSPLDTLLGIRIEKAGELLRETGLPLEQIAEECGLTSAPYLNQIFQKRYGKPPSIYRREQALRQTR